ncbi:phosphatidylethanolamine-binding protein [Cantharellus anzutake]|uniref:phosphatidylethanolamine-binding protein n=1 Tax=Cantharellus anzutake TaxID=1750568 RepID=UPI001907FE02|nr:phosphatidylethanolamine-binding protein [Cantharellus anzutake]KAF8320624.1 phosphatidylethanolamine-binding protein [Cantharellus anzutake]
MLRSTRRLLPPRGLSRPLSSQISATAQPNNWKRPLEVGVLPAYDEAVAYIEKDAAAKREKLEALRKVADGSLSPGELLKLEIESKINLPQVRWNFENNQMDLNQPVYRHLLEQKWRTKGRLDRLMERIYQMHVVPDVIPIIRPAVDVRVNFADTVTPRYISTPRIPVPEKKWAKDLSDVVPGSFVSPAKSVEHPKVMAQVFHPEPRLYTLLMIDPDVPSTATSSFQNYLHWLIPNISLSASSNGAISTTKYTPSIPYIPPHPQNGTPYHRYVLLLLPQREALSLGADDIIRLGFDVRSFASQHGLQIAHEDANSSAGGIFMWRAIWDNSVSAIYKHILELPEPRYGPPPRLDPYLDEAGQRPKKYPELPPHVHMQAPSTRITPRAEQTVHNVINS